MLVLLVSLLVPIPSSAAPPRAHKKARSFLADVFLLVDDLGRYVVLVDPDRNGSVDHAMIYEAAEPLPPMAGRFEPNARLVYSGDDGPRRVEVSRFVGAGPRHFVAEIDLDTDVEPAPRARRDLRAPAGPDLEGGVALLSVSGLALWPDAETADPDVLRQRGLPTFAEAETEHIRTSHRVSEPFDSPQARACHCRDCTAGGRGATSCKLKCSGRVIVIDFGEDCSVECGPGYYSCCNCGGLFGSFGQCECRPG